MKPTRTGDQNLVKQINKSIVFRAIQNKAPISRAQISKETRLNKATVSTMVLELINEDFVCEIGEGQSSGGRKPVMLYFNSHAGYSIGIDLGVDYILGILTDLSGNIIEKTTAKLSNTDSSLVITQIKSVIESLIKKAPESPYGIVGIGIAVPGLVGSKGDILFAPNLQWENVDIKKTIEEHFKVPTTVENEANCGSHGEKLYGAGKNIANQVYISIGAGIGTGIIINNHQYKGVSGISGELGHMTIDVNGSKCSCGNRGCWELYASEKYLIKSIKLDELPAKDNDDYFNGILKSAKMGDPKVLKLLHSLGENIGVGIVNIINTFNPEVVIIGNRIAHLENWISNPIDRTLEERLASYHKFKTEIRYTHLDTYSTSLGAASFALANFFSDKKINE